MRVYHKAIEVVRLVGRVIGPIGRHDRNLVSQLKRAASSVPLDIAEGLGHRGGNRELRSLTRSKLSAQRPKLTAQSSPPKAHRGE
jgi:four helix bundle protein